MKFLLLSCLLVVSAPLACAKEEPFYVAANDGIYRGAIEAETGKLIPLTLACAVKNTDFLALAPDGKSLYATGHDFIASFAVGPNGVLTLLNQVPVTGMGACHISVDPSGRDVLVANYNAGSVGCFRREAGGSLGKQTSSHAFVSSGPDKERQMGAHAHSIYPDPEDKIVYVCDLGGDNVWIFKFDPAQGTLEHGTPMLAKVPPGSGPRHLVFARGGRFVYVSTEMGHSVVAFSRDANTGALTHLQTISTLAPGTTPVGVTTAEIACHPSGKWLYVSNRGSETISEFATAPDGTLTLIGTVPSVAKFPRQFAIDPSGRWLIVAGQKDDHLAVLGVNENTGQLTATGQTAAANSALCVLFSN